MSFPLKRLGLSEKVASIQFNHRLIGNVNIYPTSINKSELEVESSVKKHSYIEFP
jgi:hypothetical protein